MYIYVYIYTYTHMYIYIYIYTHKYIYIYIHMHIHLLYLFIHSFIVHLCVCVFIHYLIYISILKYMFIHAFACHFCLLRVHRCQVDGNVDLEQVLSTWAKALTGMSALVGSTLRSFHLWRILFWSIPRSKW